MGTSKSAPDEVRAPNARAPHLSLEICDSSGGLGRFPWTTLEVQADASTARVPAHREDRPAPMRAPAQLTTRIPHNSIAPAVPVLSLGYGRVVRKGQPLEWLRSARFALL